MKKAFLKFNKHVLEYSCPFNNFSVHTYNSFIDVVFDSSKTIKPKQLKWINTHLKDGRWWLSADDKSFKLIIRFMEPIND